MADLFKRVNEGMPRRFCRRFIRNEAEERKFPDKVCLKVKGQIVELTEAAWDSQDIVSILQDMGLSFTRAYGYGFYCADQKCYRFFCQALKRDDKAQKSVEAGKPITKASFIKALDVVAYVMNDALKKGNAHIKIGESRKRRFEDLSVEDDAVEVSLDNIIDDSCQEIADSYDVEYQLDSDLTRWTYTIETDSGSKDNRVFSLEVRESRLSGRATAVYDVELEEISDDEYKSISDDEFRITWTGDWEDDMRSLCSKIVNWALNILDKKVECNVKHRSRRASVKKEVWSKGDELQKPLVDVLKDELHAGYGDMFDMISSERLDDGGTLILAHLDQEDADLVIKVHGMTASCELVKPLGSRRCETYSEVSNHLRQVMEVLKSEL